MKKKIIKKGLIWGVSTFVLFEFVGYLFGAKHFVLNFPDILYLSISLIVWLIAGIILAFWDNKRKKRIKSNG